MQTWPSIIVALLLTGCISSSGGGDPSTFTLALPALATYDLEDGTSMTIRIDLPAQFMDRDGQLRDAATMHIIMEPYGENHLAFHTTLRKDGLRLRDHEVCATATPCDYDRLLWTQHGSPWPFGVGLPVLAANRDTIPDLKDGWYAQMNPSPPGSNTYELQPPDPAYAWPFHVPAGRFTFDDGPWFPTDFELAGFGAGSRGRGTLSTVQYGDQPWPDTNPNVRTSMVAPGPRDPWFEGSTTDILGTGFRFADALASIENASQPAIQVDCVSEAAVQHPQATGGPLGLMSSETMAAEITGIVSGSTYQWKVSYDVDSGAYTVGSAERGSDDDCLGEGTTHLSQMLEAAVSARLDKEGAWFSVDYQMHTWDAGHRLDVQHVPSGVDVESGTSVFTPLLFQFDAGRGELLIARVGPTDVARLDDHGMQ